MSRCPACGSRKGTRDCRRHPTPVCSRCCGTSRQAATCEGCAYFKPPERGYDALPRCSTQEMEDSPALQRIAFPVETAVCSLDRARGFTLRDAEAIRIFELLLDLYAFGDAAETLAPRIAALGCESVVALVARELRDYDHSTIAKVLGAVHFVARRRAAGGRHHLEVLQRYCGSFVSSGVARKLLDDGSEVIVKEF